jgi:hypothetical protein
MDPGLGPAGRSGMTMPVCYIETEALLAVQQKSIQNPGWPVTQISYHPYVPTTTLATSGAMTITVIACRIIGVLRTITSATE